MSVLVTGGGLRWIRYRFINEQQAGTAVADSYHAVSICKAGRTIEVVVGGGTGAAFRDGRAQREFQKSAGILFCATLRPLGPVMVRAKGDWIAPLRFEPASLLEPQLLKSRVCDSLCFFYL